MRKFVFLTCVLSLAGLLYAATTQPTTRPGNRAVPADIAKKLEPDAENKVKLSDAEWKKVLTPAQFRILRQKGTERPYTNKYDHHFENGKYTCAACGQELFNSSHKYDSGCGWPAFNQPLEAGKVVITKDADGERDEVLCSRCGGHLGHVFDDGPPPTRKRFCINSESMTFIPAPKEKK